MANVGLGFFLGGVRDQANKSEELGLRKSQQNLQRTQFVTEKLTEQMSTLNEQAAKIKASGKWTPKLEEQFSAAAGMIAQSAQMSGVQLDPVGTLRRTIEGTPTPVEAGEAEGQKAATGTLAQRSGLKAGGLSDREAAAATGTEPRAVQTQNFINADTGERTFVDMTAADAPQEVARLKSQGFTEFGQAVQATEVGGLTNKEKTDFAEAELTAATTIAEIKNAKEQLGDDPLTSMAGGAVRGLTSLAGNVRQIAGELGGTAEIGGVPANESQLLNAANYTFGSFGEAAAESQAFKSNMLALAYALARAADPGGRLSDRDVQIQLDTLAAGSGDRRQIDAALDEASRRVRTAYKIRREQAISRGEALPPPPSVLREEEGAPSPNVQAVLDKGDKATAADIEALSDEELKELERFLGTR